MQVLKRKAEQRRGDDETSPEGRLQMMEDISQAEENKEEEETSGEIETSSGLPMPHIEKEGSQTATNTTRSTKQLGDMTRLTTQLGDTTRLIKQTGDLIGTSGLDYWKEVTRYGSQRSRGPSMPHTEREGSRTGKNLTRETTQLVGMTRSTTQSGGMTRSTTQPGGMTRSTTQLRDTTG